MFYCRDLYTAPWKHKRRKNIQVRIHAMVREGFEG